MPLPLAEPPRSLCLLRLSALGDVCNTLPLLRTLQARWPDTRITWVIGALEHTLVGDIEGVEFITFDKRHGRAAFRDLRRRLRGRRFDVLLHMQTALRASLVSLAVPARSRIAFPRGYAKDLQWLFARHHAPAAAGQHVLETFLAFARALGIDEPVLRWDIPLPEAARDFARRYIREGQPALVISPCSSMAYRNWTVEGYVQVAEHAVLAHGLQVLVTGGPSALEQEYGQAIAARARVPVTNLVGRTDLKQLAALLARARVVLAPDSGPAHLANAVGTPVIGLYAATNPDRARPYLWGEYVVSRYAEAVEAVHGRPVDRLPWGIRVRAPGTMARITADEVIATLDRLLAGHAAS